jgi:hypothetical protein
LIFLDGETWAMWIGLAGGADPALQPGTIAGRSTATVEHVFDQDEAPLLAARTAD